MILVVELIFEVQHHDFAPPLTDLAAPAISSGLYSVAFYQQIRQNTGNQSLRRILFKRSLSSRLTQRAQHDHTLLERINRTAFAFQTFSRGVTIDRNNQASPNLRAFAR